MVDVGLVFADIEPLKRKRPFAPHPQLLVSHRHDQPFAPEDNEDAHEPHARWDRRDKPPATLPSPGPADVVDGVFRGPSQPGAWDATKADGFLVVSGEADGHRNTLYPNALYGPDKWAAMIPVD